MTGKGVNVPHSSPHRQGYQYCSLSAPFITSLGRVIATSAAAAAAAAPVTMMELRGGKVAACSGRF